jgi:hypothetical protein
MTEIRRLICPSADIRRASALVSAPPDLNRKSGIELRAIITGLRLRA